MIPSKFTELGTQRWNHTLSFQTAVIAILSFTFPSRLLVPFQALFPEGGPALYPICSSPSYLLDCEVYALSV